MEPIDLIQIKETNCIDTKKSETKGKIKANNQFWTKVQDELEEFD